MNLTGWNQKPEYAPAFRAGVSAPTMLDIDPDCHRTCTWIPRGWPVTRWDLKFEYLLCRFYGRHAGAVR